MEHLGQTQSCFCHSFPIKLTFASKAIRSCDISCHNRNADRFCPFITWWHYSTLCTSVHWNLIFLWFWCARPSNPHSPINLIVPLFHLVEDRAPLVQIIVFIAHFLCMRTRMLIVNLRNKMRTSTLPDTAHWKLVLPFSWRNLLIFPCHSHTYDYRFKVDFPSCFLISSSWSLM